MRLWDVIATANHNLWRSKLRTSLTILAIFVGAFTLTLTNSLGAGVQNYLNRQLGDVSSPGVFYVVPKSDSNPFSADTTPKEYNPASLAARDNPAMTAADVARLQAVAGVASVRPYATVTAAYVTAAGQKKYQLGQLKPSMPLHLELAAGRLLDAQTDQDKLVLPENYLGVLGFKTAGEALGRTVQVGYLAKNGTMQEYALTVAGVSKNSLLTQGSFYIDDHALRTIYTAQTGGQLSDRFFAALVTFKTTDPAQESAQKSALEKSGAYTATSLKDQISTIENTVGAITVGLAMVGVIALLAASFGIINTLLMSVYERTQEVGLMKALGMGRRTVFLLFAAEAILVGFWGSVVAVLAAWGASQLVDAWAEKTFLSGFENFQLLVVTPSTVLLVVGLIMLIAFLAGTLPAVKASRLNPIEALRSE